MQKKFFKKLLTSISAFVLVFSTLVGIILFNSNKEIFQLQFYTTYKQILNQTKSNIDNKIYSSMSIPHKLKQLENFQKYAFEDEISYYTILTLIKELSSYASIFQNINFNISVTKIYDNHMITAKHREPIESFYDYYGFDEEARTKILELFNKIDFTGQSYILIPSVGKSGTPYISIAIKEYINEFPLLFFINFDENTLYPNNIDDSTCFLIMENEKIIGQGDFPSTKDNLLNKYDRQMLEDIASGLIVPEKDNFDIYRADLHSSTYLGVSSDVINIKYVLLSDNNIFLKESNSLIIKALIFCLFITIVGFLLAYYLSKVLYNPIENIMSQLAIRHGNLSNRNELDFIADVTKNLEASNHILNEIIENNQISLKNKFINDLLNGIENVYDLNKLLSQHNLTWMKDGTYICALEIANFSELKEIYNREHLFEIQNQLKIIIIEYLKQYARCEVVEQDYKSYVCIIGNMELTTLKKVFINILAKIELDFDIRIIASLSECFTSIENTAQHYRLAIEAKEYSYSLGRNNVITAMDFENKKNNIYFYPTDIEKELINKMSNGEVKSALILLESVLDENLFVRKLNEETQKQFLFAIIVTIEHIVKILEIDIKTVFDKDFVLYLELKSCASNEELKDKIVFIFKTLFAYSNKSLKEHDNNISHQLLTFVHENYSKDISLTDLADKFNLSTGYISKLFKNHTGSSYKDYLNLYRVAKSIEILSEKPSIKIKTLAEKVGYTSSASFIRMFKRHHNVSPGQYIQNILNKH